jgi:hypothetical protein
MVFNRLAAQIRWGPEALRSQFYEGLPRRIKDAMVSVDYDETLLGVRDAAVRVDVRYWKREAERERERLRSGESGSKQSGNASGQTGGNSGQNQKGGGKKFNSGNGRTSGSGKPSSGTSGSSTTASGNNNAKPSGSSQPKSQQQPGSNTISKNLGADGKLLPEERARRMKEGLCMRCGRKGISWPIVPPDRPRDAPEMLPPLPPPPEHLPPLLSQKNRQQLRCLRASTELR